MSLSLDVARICRKTREERISSAQNNIYDVSYSSLLWFWMERCCQCNPLGFLYHPQRRRSFMLGKSEKKELNILSSLLSLGSQLSLHQPCISFHKLSKAGCTCAGQADSWVWRVTPLRGCWKVHLTACYSHFLWSSFYQVQFKKKVWHHYFILF